MNSFTSNSIPKRETVSTNSTEWRSAWSKLPFLLFCWISLFIVAFLEYGLYYLISPRILEISKYLNTIVLALLLILFFILFAGLSLITITAITGKDLLYPHNKKSVTVKILFPIAVALSQLVRYNRNKLRASFVKTNNALTKAQAKRIKGDRILVLLPHCLQIDKCNRKITNDINNCVRCGRCPVGDLVTEGEKNGLRIEVVNGGSLARRKVALSKPDGIIAVACERDLTLGIQDVYPIPVYGVINDRPNGPCVNTCVDMTLVDDAIKFFRKME